MPSLPAAVCRAMRVAWWMLRGVGCRAGLGSFFRCVLSRVFRGKFLEQLRLAFDSGHGSFFRDRFGCCVGAAPRAACGTSRASVRRSGTNKMPVPERLCGERMLLFVVPKIVYSSLLGESSAILCP
jgi:hypothetical protein